MADVYPQFGGGGMVEWLERWTCNPEVPSSSPALSTCGMFLAINGTLVLEIN